MTAARFRVDQCVGHRALEQRQHVVDGPEPYRLGPVRRRRRHPTAGAGEFTSLGARRIGHGRLSTVDSRGERRVLEPGMARAKE